MSSYRKTMGEVYNGMYLVEGNIDKIKDIVSKKKATKIDGVMVDLFTASAISQVYDKAGSSTKKKMEILPITKLASVVMKMMGSITNPRKMKNDYVPEEVDLDEGSWHIAKNMNALKKKMQKPIPKNDLMVKFVMKHIGDDELTDEMFDAKTGTDMVPMIKSAMKRLNIKEEVDLDESVIEQLKSLAKGGSRYKPKSGAVEIKDDKGKVINKLTPEGAKKVLDKMKDPISGKSSVPDRTRGGAEKKIIDIVKNFKEEADLDEASARGDAKRSMSRDRDFGRKDDLDKDDAASDDDVKAASKNIMMQLRKAANLRGTFAVEFGDKKKVKVDPKVAQAAASKYNSLRRPADKEKFQSQIAKSYKDMLKAIKEAVSPAQQAAIAISKKERGEKPKKESKFGTINKQLKGEK
jgi:hypothetical protein